MGSESQAIPRGSCASVPAYACRELCSEGRIVGVRVSAARALPLPVRQRR